jgi:hypothetical protein
MSEQPSALERIEQLIAMGERVLSTHRPPPGNVISAFTLDDGAFTEWRTRALRTLEQLFGSMNVYTSNFQQNVEHNTKADVQRGIGILRGAKDEVTALSPSGSKEGSMPPANKPAAVAEPASKEFEKITLLWLVHHVPLKLWISAFGIVAVVFLAGVQVGQTGFLRELLGKPSLPQATPIEPAVLQDRIDRLTEGYNKNVAQITAQILLHEQAAAKTIYSHEQKPPLEAANRLRTLLDSEHKKYREAINELRGLQAAK